MTTYVNAPVPCIVSDQVKTKANEVWALLDRDEGGIRTFSVPLSPSGAPNPTAWACYTPLEQEVYDALRGHDNGDGTVTPLTNAQFDAFLLARSQLLGRPVPANANSFRAQFSMGAIGQNPYEFVEQRGFKVVTTASV